MARIYIIIYFVCSRVFPFGIWFHINFIAANKSWFGSILVIHVYKLWAKTCTNLVDRNFISFYFLEIYFPTIIVLPTLVNWSVSLLNEIFRRWISTLSMLFGWIELIESVCLYFCQLIIYYFFFLVVVFSLSLKLLIMMTEALVLLFCMVCMQLINCCQFFFITAKILLDRKHKQQQFHY